MTTRTLLLTTLLLTGLAAPAPASDFQPGELVLYTPALNGSSSSDGGVVRIDPTTGAVTPVVDLTGGSLSYGDCIAYDAYRDRLLFVGRFPDVLDPTKLWAFDGLGNASDLGFDNVTMNALAPAAGGRVYLRVLDPAAPLRYLDAANQLHTVMDASGTQPFTFPLFDVRCMVWDAGTNALFAAVPQNTLWNCGSTLQVSVHRLRLSADGTRVTAIDGCAEFVADPSGNNVPVGLTRTAAGDLIVVIDTNSNATQARMHRLDPETMTATVFAQNGYPGAAATNAGTWSSALGRTVILDTGQNVLRSYGLGETGIGTVITPSSTISSGGSGEVASLIEIPMDLGQNLAGTYCVAKTSSSGCQPQTTTSGLPSASQATGFMVGATQVEASKNGLLFYGLAGPAALPFLGGTLCVQPPLRRTGLQASGGAAPCSGAYAFDFNAWVAGGSDPQLGAGSVVHAQHWFRDPAGSSGIGLTDAATFTLAP